MDHQSDAIPQTLDRALQRLYGIYSRYPRPTAIDICPHCEPDFGHVTGSLRRSSLRELRGDFLNQYVFKAVTTIGSSDDFKYYLPRLVEIAAVEQYTDARCFAEELPIAGGREHLFWWDSLVWKLQYLDFHRWIADERDAVLAVLANLANAIDQLIRPLDDDELIDVVRGLDERVRVVSNDLADP